MIDKDRINALMAPVRELVPGYISDASLPDDGHLGGFVLHICINGKHLFYQKFLIDRKWTRSQAFSGDMANARIFSSHENARVFCIGGQIGKKIGAERNVVGTCILNRERRVTWNGTERDG